MKKIIIVFFSLLFSLSIYFAHIIIEPVRVIENNIEHPYLVAFDTDFERILFTDKSNFVYVYGLEGDFIFKFGGMYDDSSQEDWEFEKISGISVLGTNYVVADNSLNKLCFFDTSGNFINKFDLDYTPGKIKGDEDSDLYITNIVDLEIVVIDEFQDKKNLIALPDGYGEEQILDISAFGVSWEEDYIFIGDNINNKIVAFDKDGRYEYEFSSESNNRIMSIDYLNDLIIVTLENENSIYFFNEKGKLLSDFGSKGNASGEFLNPIGLSIFEDENLLAIADSGNNRIQLFYLSDLDL